MNSVESEYSFPHHISPTNLRPDMVWWSDEVKEIRLLELTISYETVLEQAHQRKLAKYEDVVEEAMVQGYNVECFAVEVGSRGLNALGAPARAMTELAGSLSRTAMLGSFKIWCSRNVQQ